jgi:hypothetical protein
MGLAHLSVREKENSIMSSVNETKLLVHLPALSKIRTRNVAWWAPSIRELHARKIGVCGECSEFATSPSALFSVILTSHCSCLQVDNRYINLKPIGRGAYGLVASADDSLTGRKVCDSNILRIQFHFGHQTRSNCRI